MYTFIKLPHDLFKEPIVTSPVCFKREHFKFFNRFYWIKPFVLENKYQNMVLEDSHNKNLPDIQYHLSLSITHNAINIVDNL